MSILGTIFGSSVKSKATGKARDALIDAAGQAKTATTDAANQVVGLNAPGVDLYGRSINALSARAGLGDGLGAVASPNLATQGVAPTSGWSGVDRSDPDAVNMSVRPANALTTSGAASASPLISPGSFGDLSNPTLALPDAPNIGPTPTMGPLNISAEAYQESPGLKFALERGLGAIDSNFAHRGAFNSGAAGKELAGFATGLLNQDYGDWRDKTTAQYNADRSSTLDQYNKDRASGLTQYNADRSFAEGRYTDSRDYLTGQYNQQTDDLSALAATGSGAVTTTGNALTRIGTAGADAANAVGSARAGSALQKGNIWSGAINDIDGQIQRALAGLG